MRRKNFIEIISFFLRICLGFVFIFAAVGKINNPDVFYKEISNYRIFPDFISQIIAIVLPWIEVFIGLLLVLGLRVKTTSFISTILIFFFTIMVASAWIRGLNINCGCFSGHIEYVGLKKILENVLLILFGIFLFYFPNSFLSLEFFLKKEIQKDFSKSEVS